MAFKKKKRSLYCILPIILDLRTIKPTCSSSMRLKLKTLEDVYL